VHIADKNTPLVAVDLINYFGFDNAFFVKLKADLQVVPIPDHAEPADGDDAEMTIYQPCTDTLWELGRAWKNRVTGRWHACWGGRIQPVSKWEGIWPYPFGATATGLPFTGGQITAEELVAGEIKHVIGIALYEAADGTIKPGKPGFSWPANRSDGEGCHGTICILEGLRFRLNPDVTDQELGMLHPVGKMIAKAAQKYGFVVWDKAGATSLRAKNPKSFTREEVGEVDPYCELFAPKDQWTVLEGFPWDKLQFLPPNYGRP
jgi:hypothetical protein